MLDGANQQALIRFAQNDGRAGRPALAKPFARVDKQLTAHLLRLAAMTAVAVRDEQRANAFLEELHLLCRQTARPDRTGSENNHQTRKKEARRHRVSLFVAAGFSLR